MEKITITKNGNALSVDADKLPFNTVVSLLFNALAATVKQTLRTLEKDASDRHTLHEAMYDQLDALFAKVLKDIFPDVEIRQFDLLTAAIVKAEDDIINMAAEEGITYEEALDKYNKLSSDYIAKRGTK